MGKEKLVYVLNPDGLTESIFVARGEKNEGEYRGKRFTKAGAKAERKRQQEELKASISINSLDPLGDLETKESSGMSYDDYYGADEENQNESTQDVKVHGSIKGWIGIFDDKSNILKYYEQDSIFKNKDAIREILKEMNVTASKINFFKNREGAFIFKGEGTLTTFEQ